MERKDICPYNILIAWNIANTMHSDNYIMQPDHVALTDELVRQNEFEFSFILGSLGPIHSVYHFTKNQLPLQKLPVGGVVDEIMT